jgi:hypothetical protein
MRDCSKRWGAARCALAFLIVFGFAPYADAAFTVTINGTSITDNGPGDTDSSAGFIHFAGTISGYQIQLTSSTDNSHPTADLTTSQLRIVNTTGTAPLVVTLTESFNQPLGYTGQQNMQNTLTRNQIAGLGNSGVVSSTTGGVSQSGGGQGTTAAVILTNTPDSGMSFGSFNRTSDFYTLTQTITISGLLGSGNPATEGDGVTITASSFSSSPANLSIVPAPPALALLAGGVLTLGLYQLRRRLMRQQ